MGLEQGRIHITMDETSPAVPKASSEGTGIPPTIRTAFGLGDGGNGENIPHHRAGEESEPGDADLFWAFHRDDIYDLPGLEEILDKHGLLSSIPMPEPPPTEPRPLTTREYVGAILPRRRQKESVDVFLDKARERGLLKPEPLTLRKYIGAILR